MSWHAFVVTWHAVEFSNVDLDASGVYAHEKKCCQFVSLREKEKKSETRAIDRGSQRVQRN